MYIAKSAIGQQKFYRYAIKNNFLSYLKHKMEQNSEINAMSTNNKDKRQKLKILALHGYRQNGTVFRGKIGSFRKGVSKYAQLVFVSAPHKVISDDGAGDEGNSISLITKLNYSIIYFLFYLTI